MPSREEALSAVRTLIEWIGDDPNRPGLINTPARVLDAWQKDWGSGYRVLGCQEIVRIFPLEAVDSPDVCTYNQMIVVRDIDFFSHCEHHMTPFFGQAHVAYLPAPQVGLLGLSKMARIVDYFARRLQLQERLTEEVADFLQTNLSESCAVMLQATHMCMCSRGVQQAHTLTRTTALRGEFLSDPAVKAEFLSACR